MIQKMKLYISTISLGKKILIGFSVVIIINLILFLVVFNLYADLLKNMAVKNSRIAMRLASQNIKTILKDGLTLSNSIVINNNLKKIISTKGLSYTESLELTQKGNEELAYISIYYPHIFGLHMVGINGIILQSKPQAYYEEFSQSYWFHHIIGLNKPTWYMCDRGSIVAQTPHTPVLYVCVPVIDNLGKAIGTVIADIQIKTIRTIIDEGLDGVGTLYPFNDSLSISPEYQSIVSKDPYLERINNILFKNKHSIHEEKDIIVITENIGVDGWEIAGIINKKKLFGETNIILLTSLISLMFIFIVSFVCAVIISKTVTHPISELITLMRQVENGNLQVRMEVNTQDEIGKLGNSFNIMVKRIKYLLSSIYNDQIKLRAVELTALQAQINPHFLYNTLESINWLARYRKNDQIIKMISALTTFFRMGINRGENIISVSEEISHVKSYLTIQHMRYANSFDYKIEIPEKVLSYYTVKLILQPIVENAIYHGVKMRKKRGLVVIRAEETVDSLFFIVEDNGPGMDPMMIEQFNSKNPEKLRKTDSSSYGLKNVRDRIRVFFGKEYGLHFSSSSGRGTRVVIHIPKRKGSKTYDSCYSCR